ncbi:MAG: aromatic amino acid lyase [Eubacteriales bacterium]
MTAIGACVRSAVQLMKTADIVAALTCEAQSCITGAFDARTRAASHLGQICAKNLRALLKGQRAHQLKACPARCRTRIPSAAFRRSWREPCSALCLQAILAGDQRRHRQSADLAGGWGRHLRQPCGNHGQPMALAFDFLGIALSGCQRVRAAHRAARGDHLNNNLPAFLTPNGELNSGFMIAQYAAAASLVPKTKFSRTPCERGLDSVLRQSGGSREHGHHRGAQKPWKFSKTRSACSPSSSSRPGRRFRCPARTSSRPQRARRSTRAAAARAVERDVVMHEQMERCEQIVRAGA